MVRHVSRFLPLGHRQPFHWELLIAFPLVLSACGKSQDSNSPSASQTPGSGTTLPGGTGQQTDFSILVAPDRRVDILFLVDNSPSMDPKQKALADNFPKMIEQLDALPDGRPDLHIGVVSSDIGAGGRPIGGNCNVVLGDRGLLWGNVPVATSNWDPNNPQPCYDNSPVRATIAPGSCWALAQTPPITNGCGLNENARWIEDIQPPPGSTQRQVNYTGAPNALPNVFSCLAKGVGVGGCGFEHQLQAVRVALNPQQIGCDAQGKNCTDVNMANVGFLRSGAYLAIILITDEDDCSGEPNNATNDNIFVNSPRDPNNAPTETSSMRCATRGHICNGNPIPDYADPTRGYTGTGFTANFTDCKAKDQSLPGDNGLLPLIAVQDMVSSVIGVTTDNKGNTHKDKILVSGIFGWPPDVWPLPAPDPNWPSDVVVSSLANTKYQIGKDATSIKGQQDLWDYMPICKIPSQTSSDTNIYKAYGGLRLKEFVDSFKRIGENGKEMVNTFSICKSNFTDAMKQIGQAIAKVLTPGCVPYPLIDIQPSVPDGGIPGPLQPECQATDHQPCGDGNGCYNDTSILECKDSQGKPLDPNLLDPGTAAQPLHSRTQIDAVLNTISQDQRPCWYLSYDHSDTGCPAAPNGQRISALRKTGTVAPPGTRLAMKCLTCTTPPDQPCPRLYP
jgi:hypothetical protein